MSRKARAITVFLILCGVCVAHALWYYPQLPEEIAQHFNSSGQPDGWGSKQSLVYGYMGTVGFMALMFLGLGLYLPKIPNSLINLPNKDYWLAPERRESSMENIVSPFLWLGSLTLLFMLDIFHQIFTFNLGDTSAMGHFKITMIVYFTLIILWTVWLFLKFRKPADAVGPDVQ